MKRLIVSSVIGSVVAAVLAVASAVPAGALDCDEPAEATIEDFANGTAMLTAHVPFADSGAYAILGEVKDRGAPAENGSGVPSEYVIEVSAVFGRDSIDRIVTVSNDDYWGVDWPVGESRLFIVWQPDGRLPALDICSAGIIVSSPEDVAAEVAPLAAASGVSFAIPDDVDAESNTLGEGSGEGAEQGDEAALVGSSDSGNGLALWVAAGFVVAALVVTVMVLTARRDPQDG